MMFIDASVILAVLLAEDDAHHFLARLEAAQGRVYTSPIARLEAIVTLARAKSPTPETTSEMINAATAAVDQFLAEIPTRMITISADMGQRALDAAAQYGRIVGHPAKLSLGDCLTYAAARTYRLPILHKGTEFDDTDIIPMVLAPQ